MLGECHCTEYYHQCGPRRVCWENVTVLSTTISVGLGGCVGRMSLY